ncbi:MAG: hypothetical protein KDH19_18970, partial [Geminicoccaceae bacterium]|nr:hypothetical protein [Geminicoccaceae bacterium]
CLREAGVGCSNHPTPTIGILKPATASFLSEILLVVFVSSDRPGLLPNIRLHGLVRIATLR